MQNVEFQSPDLIASVELARSLMPADSSIEQAFASVDQSQPVQVAGAVVNSNSKQGGLMESNSLESFREDLFKAETAKKIWHEGVEVGISTEAVFAAADAKVVILANNRLFILFVVRKAVILADNYAVCVLFRDCARLYI